MRNEILTEGDQNLDDFAQGRSGRVLAVAELIVEAEALGQAALASDWEEARFRSFRINALAFDLGSQRVAQVARDVTRALGRAGTSPSSGYGMKIAFLSQTI